MRHTATRLCDLLLLSITLGLVSTCGEAPTPGSQPNGSGGASSVVADLSDRRRLVCFVDHVFVGRVRAAAGTLHDLPPAVRKPDDPGFPLYTVEVLESIKGTLPREVIVDWPKLELGREYVFATNPSPDGQRQLVVGPEAGILLDGPPQRAQVIAAFRQAYAHEIPRSETMREYWEKVRRGP